MKLKIGIIGLERRLNAVKEISKEYSNTISFEFILLSDLPDKTTVTRIIDTYEKMLDGIIFTGHMLYDYFIKHKIPSIIWDYFHRGDLQLYRSLFNIMQEYDMDKVRISIDSYSVATIKKILDNLNVSDLMNRISVAKLTDQDVENMDYYKNFHETAYNSGKVDCCITGASMIYEYLTEKSIPCYTLDPVPDSIRETIYRVILKNQSMENKKSQIVVIAVEIDALNEYSIFQGNEYQYVIDRMSIAKSVYHFAQKIDGAVMSEEINKLFIFTTRKILEQETQNYKKLDLMETVKSENNRTISLGIGFGSTVREAKKNAIIGAKKSNSNGGNQAFIVYDNNHFLGPLRSEKELETSDNIIVDNILHKISNVSNLSINSVYKLYCIILQNNKDVFTPKELAEQFGVTLRSMYRIIEKLEISGYAKVIGKKIIGDSGRPTRIVKIDFDISNDM